MTYEEIVAILLDETAGIGRDDVDEATSEMIAHAGVRIYAPWDTPDRLEFAFNDPPTFHATGTVTPDIFVKVLKHLKSKTGLSDDDLIRVVNKFALSCTREDWTNLYQPILRRVPFPGITTHTMVDWLRVVPKQSVGIRPRVRSDRLTPTSPTDPGMFYPVEENSHLLTCVVWRDSITIFSDNYRDIWAKLTDTLNDSFEGLFNQSNLEYPLLIDILVSVKLHETDFTTTIDLIDLVPHAQHMAWPGAFRRARLEELFNQFLSENSLFALGDGYPGNPVTDRDKVIAHFTALGYGGITQAVFIADDKPYGLSTTYVPLLRGLST